MSTFRRLAAAGALVLASSLCSCFSTIGKWTYPSGRYPTTESARPSDAVIAVEPFVDLRSSTNRSWIPWAYVPLSPGGWTHFDRPEATGSQDFTPNYDIDPCEDLAESIAIELVREKLVRGAVYLPHAPTSEHTHVLRGKLRTFYVHEERWSYLVSVNCWVFWGLGLPVGRSDNGILVELELVDVKDGRVVWKGSIFDADSHIEGWYYGPDWYRFSWMWERRLRERLVEFAAALGAEPAPLPLVLVAESVHPNAPVMPKCLGVDSTRPCTAW